MSNFEGLIQDLESSDLNRKINAIEELGQLGDPKAIKPLSKLINDTNEQVRECSIWSLGRLKASEILIKNLNHKVDSTRKFIVEVLGNIEEKIAVVPLIELLKDPDDEMRANAAWSLGKIGDRKAFEPLIKSLSDKSEQVRENAAWALGKLNDFRAIPHLLHIINDPDEIVQNNAKESIEKIYRFLEKQEEKKEKIGKIYECPATNEFCKQEEKVIKIYSDNNIALEILMCEKCKSGKICEVKLN
ncbi:MAG: HEAT repeat domain-containing protein [Candidatus Helarchaeota archaeon]